MTIIAPRMLTYSEIRVRLRTHALRQYEVPIEYSVSLPLPTLRCGQPGYAAFASGTTHNPEQPVVQSAPDRWWVLDAASAQVLIYALTRVYSFTSELTMTPQTLPIIAQTLAEMQLLLDDMETKVEAVTPAFFDGADFPEEQKQAALNAMQTFLPTPLLPQYQALAPDFFAWLQQLSSSNG